MEATRGVNLKANVLIVDDDSVCLNLLRGSFSQYADRFSVLTAGDGLEALDVMAREPVALIVTDLIMPRLDGSELLQRLAEDHPHVPRMVMTSLTAPLVQLPLGLDDILDYIVKPVATAELADKILTVVESQRESGFLRGISISSFVQLLDIEGKTCTIILRGDAGGSLGTLYFRDGNIIDGRRGGQRGFEAVCEIISWQDARISIIDACPDIPDAIQKRTQEILLVVAQRIDESPEARAARQKRAARLASPFYELKQSVTPSEPSDSPLRQKLRDLQNRAFAAYNAGDFVEARHCWMELLLHSPESKIVEHNLRVVEEQLRARQA